MGRNYSKAVIILITLFMTSCAFDPQNGKLVGLGKGYFVSYDKHSPRDGIKIEYLIGEDIFKLVASNCIDIYKDSDIIVFNKSLSNNDTINCEYFLIEKKSKDGLKKINKSLFLQRIENLEKVIVEK